ncbi:MAG: 50S ribosomal protein L7/L12 [Lachnospiraceae bacterium]|jgi:large subunit ribosomal protein L7/L12|nr:50S ribosomal protein L7/L12 [Lachnospiraceae bacterium]
MEEFSKDKLIDTISSLSVLELSELIKALEVKFGVEANQIYHGNNNECNNKSNINDTKQSTEQTEFDITLTNIGSSKINVIKAVREITNLGLKEAKDLVESVPKILKSKISKSEAEEIRQKFSNIGATVEIK